MMATHYDNLKVSRDAPLGVIKASYRKLSQKYHPDRNPDPKALEIMKMINQAWDVLSDPERRARHDRAIDALEERAKPQQAPSPAAKAPRHAPASRPPKSAPAAPHSARPARMRNWFENNPMRMVGVLVHLLIVVLVIVFQVYMASGTPEEEPPAITLTPPEMMPGADIGQPDRIPHGYLMTSAQDFSPGIAMVEIDNTAGAQDAEVRLFIHGRAARSIYVHQGKRFRVEDLAPGTYVLKYKIVSDGKVLAYQQREVFRPQRGIFSKMQVRLPAAAGSLNGADQIAVDQF